MIPSSAARRYAEAAFDVAREGEQIDEWRRELQAVSDGMSNSEVALFFKDPRVTHEEKVATIGKLFPTGNKEFVNLLTMLVIRDRMHLAPAIAREFESLDRAARGVVEADVTVARAYGEAETAEIAVQLSAATGKRVHVRIHVDPTILGGIVVRIGDRLIDASVGGRLERLRQQMAV